MEKQKPELTTDLYSFNKAQMAQIKPMNKKWLNNKYMEVAKKIMKNEFWMLLCREKNDYTIFYFHMNLENCTDALKETIENRGSIIDFAEQPDGAYEIWIRDTLTKENFAYYLFDYSQGIVEE